MKPSKLFLSILFFLASFAATQFAEAKLFKNAYISFEIEDDWDCTARAPEWICRSKDPQASREAVIILTAKEVGPTDRWDLYIAHMNSSQTVQMKNGVTLNSRVVYKAQQNRYNGQPWLDGLHQDSEVKNYFTRYLATIKDEIAVLVTFSAHTRFYAKYNNAFMRAIQSLKILSSRGNFPTTSPKEPIGTNNPGGDPLGPIDDGPFGPGGDGGSGSGKEKLLGFGILIAAILGYIGYRYYSSQKNS